MADDKSQLKVAEQLAKVLEQQAARLEGITREINAQYEITKKIIETVKSAGDLEDPLQKAKDVKGAIKEISEETSKGKDLATQHGEALKDAMTKSENSSLSFLKALQKVGGQFPVMKTAAIAATHGIVEGFRAAGAITSSFLKTTASIVTGIGKIGIAILSIPFKIFQALIDKAESGGGGNELAAAYEKVRKQFGDFRQDAAHNVIKTAHDIDKQFKETGLNTFMVFGNLAQRLEEVNKIATAMGATWDVLGKEFAENSGHLLAYQKGLGVAEENMKDFAQAAISSGKPMQEVMRETASLSLSMQKQFGGSAKLYSRDMSKMINDVKHFGGVSQKIMVEVAVYTRKLGLETEKLLGMLDKFDTFDEAAQSAAKLAQTYGAQVDAFKLMTAESPVEQLDMIRKAMFEAGKTAETMDRKDFKYIASLTAMDEASVRAALSSKNMGVSLDKVKEGSAKAEKQQLSQAEAMAKLAGAIERMTFSGQEKFGGFIKALIKGFNDGIEWSQDFMKVMFSIRQDMRIMYWAGRELGKVFVDSFPGVKDILQGIGEIFDPKKFQKLANGIVEVFKKFFTDMSDSPKTALPELMKNLKAKFFDFFNSESAAGSKVISGFRKFLMALGQIAGGVTKFMLESLRDGFKLITDLMSGKGAAQIGAGASGAKKFMIELFTPIFEAIRDVWPSLKDAFVTMIETAWDKIKKSGVIERAWEGLKKYMLVVGMGAMGAGAAKGIGALILGGLAKGVGGAVATGMAGLIGNAVKNAGTKAATAGGTNVLGSAAKTLGDKPAENASSLTGAAKKLDEGGKSGINWKGIGGFLLGLAGVIAVGLASLWGAIKIFGDVPVDKILKGLLVIGGVATALLPAAGAVALIGIAGRTIDPKSAAVGVGAIALAVGAMSLAIGAIYGAFSLLKVDFGRLKDFTSTILEMSKVFILTGGVVAEAMIIGAVITATGGVGGVAALAGFTAIGLGVAAMATSVTGIIKALATVPFAADMKDKVDAFVKVLSATTEFAKVYSDILTASRPTFMQLVTGNSKSAKDDLDAVTKFVSTMIGPPGGMIGLVTTLMDAITKLSGEDQTARKAAETMAGLLSALATMAGAIAPPKELFSNGFKLIETGDATRNALQGSQDYVSTMTSSIQSLMDKVKTFITFMKTGGISEKDLQTAALIGPLFQAIAQITVALKPTPELINAAKDAKGDVQGNVMVQIGDLIRAQGNQVKSVVESMANSIMPAAKSLGGLDKGQIESLKVVAPLIDSLFKAVSNITGAFTTILLSKNLNTGIDTKNNLIKVMMSSVGTMIQSVATELPSIFTSLSAMPKIAEKGAIEQTKTSLKVVGDMIASLNSLTSMLSDGNLTKLDVAPKLEAMAKKVGLGGSGTYTITHKPITITLNLDIHMDAKQIEYGIINRNGLGQKVVVVYDEEKRKNNV